MDHETLADALATGVVEASGESTMEERLAAKSMARAVVSGRPADGGRLSDAEASFLRGMILDPVGADPRPLLEAGVTEDRLFELVLATAVERGRVHLEAGLAALAQATQEDEA